MLLISLLISLLSLAILPLATASPADEHANDLSSAANNIIDSNDNMMHAPAVGVACGKATCAGGEYCCNPSCSMCVGPGMMCTMQDCGHVRDPPTTASLGPRPPSTRIMTRPKPTHTRTHSATPRPSDPAVCGKNICPADQVCCNSSCGICTPPDGACIMLFCPDGQMPSSIPTNP